MEFRNYDIIRSVIPNGKPVLCYLSNRAPKREELQVVPEDKQLPPSSILKWGIIPTIAILCLRRALETS